MHRPKLWTGNLRIPAHLSPTTEAKKEVAMDFAEAEAIIDSWDYRSLPDGEQIIEAIDKSKQALRDCQDMGLNGED